MGIENPIFDDSESLSLTHGDYCDLFGSCWPGSRHASDRLVVERRRGW